MKKKKATKSKSRTASSVKDLSVSPRTEKTVKGGAKGLSIVKYIDKASPKLFSI